MRAERVQELRSETPFPGVDSIGPLRTFVLEGETRRFWDISWHGPSVEITSGKWGTNGRAREEVFASPGEREAFVDAEIALGR